MKKILWVCMLVLGTQVFAASPKLQQLETKVVEAIENERWIDAVAMMEKMIAMKEPLPKDFKYFYGMSLAMTQQYEKAYTNVDEYMEEQGRNAKFYVDARNLGRDLWRLLAIEKGDAWLKQQEKKNEAIRAKEEAVNQLAAKQLAEIKEAEKLAARPNLRNLVILGGGGTLKTAKSTAFDATLTAASAFYQRSKWNATIAFDTGREETQRLLDSAFANANTVTSFSQNNFNVIVNYYGKALAIKSGDQVLLVIDGYGALKNGDEASHSVAVYDVEEPFDLNTLKGAKTLSLDLLKPWAEAAKQKGAKLAIVDFTSHSGNTLALANANTCVVSGTGPLHFRSGIFVQELFKKMQAGKSLESVFLEARKDTADTAFPMISTAQGVAINQEVYPLFAPYLYTYADDPLSDKMVPYLTEALSDAGYAKREQQYKELVRRLNGLQAKNNTNAAAIQNLKALLSQYKEKQDAYINGARSMGAGNLSRREQITGEAELGGMKGRLTTNLSWAEIVTSDTEQILKNLRSAREGGRNAQFLADMQAGINMHTKVQERKNEILATYPSLKEYKSRLQTELEEIRKASGLAVEIAKQERVIYDALYNSAAGERERSSGNACKNFVF